MPVYVVILFIKNITEKKYLMSAAGLDKDIEEEFDTTIEDDDAENIEDKEDSEDANDESDDVDGQYEFIDLEDREPVYDEEPHKASNITGSVNIRDILCEKKDVASKKFILVKIGGGNEKERED